MRKICALLLFLLLGTGAFAQQTGVSAPPASSSNVSAPQPAPTGAGASGNQQALEPVGAIMQAALQSDAALLAKHKDVQKYFTAFLPIWNSLFVDLQSAQERATGLEDQFAKYYAIIQRIEPQLKKVKAPSDFKDFGDSVSKALDDLSDWVQDMKDRIHYAQTDYQREAYLKRLQDFQSNWYDTYFGPVVDQLNASWAVYLNTYWMDELSAKDVALIKKDRELYKYLAGYHSISSAHLRAANDIEKKARDDEDDDDDPTALLKDIQKEVAEIQKTEKKMAKLSPPPVFKDFHTLELQWMALMEQSTQKLLDIQTAEQAHEPDEKLQDMVNQKNQLDEQSKALRDQVDQAYTQALNSIQ